MIATKKPRKLHARRSPRYTRPMRAVVYTRFSPRRNASDSVSCEVQEDLCMDLANLRGWPVHSMHRDEGVSGKTMDRPGLEAALAELGPDDVLLVYRRDRLARDLLLAELIRRQVAAAGARIVAVEGDVDGDADDPHLVFVRQVMDAVAELERKMIAARTKASMRAQQRAGKRVGRYAPYGYRIDPDDPTRLLSNPDEQAAAARARELMAQGLSAYAVAKQLDQEYPDACRGKRWGKKTVAKIAERKQP
ncbi:MAG: recombinase family protein [Planctomycetes bacterium]|nr:recombinase family protein [Planctomycetota bacterium]